MCKLTKPRADFSEERRTVRGVSRRCRACVCAVQKKRRDADPEAFDAAARQWKLDNPEKRRAANAAWYRKNRTTKLAKDKVYAARQDVRARQKVARKAWAERNRERHKVTQLAAYHANRVHRLTLQARYRIMAKFGMDRSDYEALAARQKFGRCESCGKSETRKNTRGTPWRLSIDHDHETGAVRGVLCGNCNSALGLLLDDVATIRKLADYLESRQKNNAEPATAG